MVGLAVAAASCRWPSGAAMNPMPETVAPVNGCGRSLPAARPRAYAASPAASSLPSGPGHPVLV